MNKMRNYNEYNESDSDTDTNNVYTGRNNNTIMHAGRPIQGMKKNIDRNIKNKPCNYNSRDIVHDGRRGGSPTSVHSSQSFRRPSFTNRTSHSQNRRALPMSFKSVFNAGSNNISRIMLNPRDLQIRREGSPTSVHSSQSFRKPFSNRAVSPMSFRSVSNIGLNHFSNTMLSQRDLSNVRDRSPVSVRSMQSFQRPNFSTRTLRDASPVSVRSMQSFQRPNFSTRTLRDKSPVSVRSMQSFQRPDFSTRTLHDQIRGTSPMSFRSVSNVGSNTSISAQDIALALKNADNYNKRDLNLLENTFRKFIKGRVCKRRTKRRKIRIGMKSGGESGEQGSNSSLSSDDCGSVKSNITVYKRLLQNECSLRVENKRNDDSRSITSGLSARKYTSESTLKRNFKQNGSKYILSAESRQLCNNSFADRPLNNLLSRLNRDVSGNNFSMHTTKPVDILPITEEHQNEDVVENTIQTALSNRSPNKHVNHSVEESDDQENIFNVTSIQQRQSNKNNPKSIRKANSVKAKLLTVPNEIDINKKTASDFIFTKPKTPVKSFPKEPGKTFSPIEKEQPIILNMNDTAQQSSSDLSLRPSFIRRKLFTQTLEVTENKDHDSNDSLPQSPISNIYKSNASYKSRKSSLTNSNVKRALLEDKDDDNANLRDLIHKIVSPDRMNAQGSIPATDNQSSLHEKNNRDSDKWDVLSIMSMHNKDDISETFSDNDCEALNIAPADDQVVKSKNKQKTTKGQTTMKKSQIDRNTNKRRETAKHKNEPCCAGKGKSKGIDISKRIKSFWDIDSGSESENLVINSSIEHATSNEEIKPESPMKQISKKTSATNSKKSPVSNTVKTFFDNCIKNTNIENTSFDQDEQLKKTITDNINSILKSTGKISLTPSCKGIIEKNVSQILKQFGMSKRLVNKTYKNNNSIETNVDDTPRRATRSSVNQSKGSLHSASVSETSRNKGRSYKSNDKILPQNTPGRITRSSLNQSNESLWCVSDPETILRTKNAHHNPSNKLLAHTLHTKNSEVIKIHSPLPKRRKCNTMDNQKQNNKAKTTRTPNSERNRGSSKKLVEEIAKLNKKTSRQKQVDSKSYNSEKEKDLLKGSASKTVNDRLAGSKKTSVFSRENNKNTGQKIIVNGETNEMGSRRANRADTTSTPVLRRRNTPNSDKENSNAQHQKPLKENTTNNPLMHQTATKAKKSAILPIKKSKDDSKTPNQFVLPILPVKRKMNTPPSPTLSIRSTKAMPRDKEVHSSKKRRVDTPTPNKVVSKLEVSSIKPRGYYKDLNMYGLGVARSRINIIPRHCRREGANENGTFVHDDTRSVTTMSTTSTMSRSRRGFLHVF